MCIEQPHVQLPSVIVGLYRFTVDRHSSTVVNIFVTYMGGRFGAPRAVGI